MLEPTLNDGEAYVDGRSEDKARELHEAAKRAGIDWARVSTTSHGYIVPAELVETEEAEEESAEEAEDEAADYDPTEHTVAEVKEYLDGADDAERQRVLDVEANSDKPRAGLVKEGDK